MLKRKRLLAVIIFVLLLGVLFTQSNLKADPGDWTLVWSDEFNAPDGSPVDLTKWSLLNSSDGWGGSSQIYRFTDRIQNSYQENGNLVIKTIRENYAGYSYTSAKLYSQNKGDWTYGRFVVRAKLPHGPCLWPSIWMLPTTSSYGGWPVCGEIDIMENRGDIMERIDGTVFYGNPLKYNINTYYLPAGQSFGDDFHEFALEWEPNVFRWYVDNNLYQTQTDWYCSSGAYPAPFDVPFYLQIQVAVGNSATPYTGFQTPDPSAFPQYMCVDYARVYQRNGPAPTPVPRVIPGKIEAEDYDSILYHNPPAIVDCSEGGSCIGPFQTDEWVDYLVNVQTDGTYHADFRVASATTTGKIDFRDGNTSLAELTVPNTGGSQAWTTISTNLNLNAGMHTLRVYASGAGWRFNWFNFTLNPIKIEAENYVAMSGIQTQSCSEGGLNVGWIDANDWMDYTLDIPGNGSYRIDYRVASPNGTGKVDFRTEGSTLVCTVIPNTGGWQSWGTVSANTVLNQGIQTIRLFAKTGGWNINWFVLNPMLPTPTPSPTPLPTPHAIPGKIEAENYYNMSGVQTESCSEGGLNVGWIDTGDWINYFVYVQTTGTYRVDYRVASPNNTGTVDLQIGSTTQVSASIPNTGGWQSWTTVSATVSLTAGYQNFRLFAASGGWNINWFQVALATVTETPSPTPTPTPTPTSPGYTLTVSFASYASAASVSVDPPHIVVFSDGPFTDTYQPGTIVTLRAEGYSDPYVGTYTFEGWTGDLTGNQSLVSITMNSNKSVVAHFTHTGSPTPSPSFTPSPTPGLTLLSQGKPTSASSYQAGNEVYKANDGNTGTRWAALSGAFPQWWQVDLGSVKELRSADIFWYNNSSRAYQYKIEVSSDNINFATVVDKTDNTTYGITFDSFIASGRYVRVTITGSTTGWASFNECSVYGY